MDAGHDSHLTIRDEVVVIEQSVYEVLTRSQYRVFHRAKFTVGKRAKHGQRVVLTKECRLLFQELLTDGLL